MPEPIPTASSRPVVSIKGEVDDQISDRTTAVLVQHRLGAPATLLLDLLPSPTRPEGPDEQVAISERLALGTPVAIETGDPADAIFSGRVTASAHQWPEQGPPTVRITAHDTLDEWRYSQHTRRFEQMSVADIVNGLANAHGVSVQVAAAASELQRQWTQFNQTDFDFLAQLCAHIGADFFCEDGELFVQTSALANNSAITLEYGRNLKTFSVRANLAEQRTHVAVQGWDPATKQTIERQSAYPAAELRDCESGPDVLHERYVQPTAMHLRNTVHSHVQADALTRAVYEDRAHRFVTARGESTGEPGLLVGEWVSVGGIGGLRDASYYVREVNHRYTQQDGYTTAFIAESACSGTAEERGNASDDQRDRGDDGACDGSRRKRRIEPFERLGLLIRTRRARRRKR